MSEEEKKSIEYYNGKEFSFTLDIPEDKMQELKKALGITDNEEDSFESHQIRIQTLLNLIDRLQKELEQEKLKNEALKGTNDDLNSLYLEEKEKNKRYKKALLYMINQFAYDEKTHKEENEPLYTGGLGALEEAFDVLDINEGIKRKDIWKMIRELLGE